MRLAFAKAHARQKPVLQHDLVVERTRHMHDNLNHQQGRYHAVHQARWVDGKALGQGRTAAAKNDLWQSGLQGRGHAVFEGFGHAQGRLFGRGNGCGQAQG